MPALPHGTGPSGITISDPNPLIPRNLSHDGAVRPGCCKAFSSKGLPLPCFGRLHAAIATAAFTAMAMKTVLKKKDTTPCQSTVRRMVVVFTATSDTWHVMPTTKEK